jgi:ankyrin repeat protein
MSEYKSKYLKYKKKYIELISQKQLIGGDDRENLYKACKFGNIVELSRMIDKKVNIDDYYEDNKTPLLIACENNNYYIALKLIEENANIDFQDIYGNTALHYACKNNNYDIVLLLIEKGANSKIKNRSNQTLLHMISSLENVNLALVKLLIDQKIDLNSIDLFGRTFLYNALERSNQNLVKFIMDYNSTNTGAIELVDNKRRTPLHIVANFIPDNKKHASLIMFLIKNGINMYAKDEFGDDVLSCAIKQNNVLLVGLLIDEGFNCNDFSSTVIRAGESKNIYIALVDDIIENIEIKKLSGIYDLFLTTKENLCMIKFLIQKNIESEIIKDKL